MYLCVYLYMTREGPRGLLRSQPVGEGSAERLRDKAWRSFCAGLLARVGKTKRGE